MTEFVERRIVFHVGGYDPVPPAAAHKRFVRELGRFRSTWGVAAQASQAIPGPDLTDWTVTASGPDWRVASAIRLLRWDDLMAEAARRSAPRRLGLGLLAGADFVAGGALRGYARHAWRYALFFLYPYLLIAGLAGLAAAAGWLVAGATRSGLFGVALSLSLAAGLLVWAGEALRLSHLLDDWIFARAWLRGGEPLLAARLDRVAAELVAACRSGEADEVLVVGHSLGAVLAIDLVDRALALEPGIGRGGARLALVTVGSSIPKIGLHRGATRFRAALGRVIAAERVFWVEYQALADVMNFYKFSPAALVGGGDRPSLRIVRISRMLDQAYYRRIRSNFFRIHNQFVSANDLRTAYDYCMMLCGPLSVEAQAGHRDGPAGLLGPDCALASGVAGAPPAAPRQAVS